MSVANAFDGTLEELDALTKEPKICPICEKEVTGGNFVITRDRVFHAEHFVCDVCSKPLAGLPFIERDGKVFDEEHYHEKYSPKCGRCDKVITDQYLEALGQAWHPDHFVCNNCGKPFEEGRFRQFDGQPYDDECYAKVAALKCDKCGEVITDRVFTAQDLNFHEEHFVCSVDEKPIAENEPFHVRDEKLFCAEHYAAEFKKTCLRCGEVIAGKFVRVLDKQFHQEHFTCVDCGKSLLDGDFVLPNDDDDGKFRCTACAAKRAEKLNPTGDKSASTTQGAADGNGADGKSAASAAAAAASDLTNIPAFSVEEDTSRVESLVDQFAEDRPAHCFSLLDLQKQARDCDDPKINRTKLEDYLSHREFESVFGMTREEFGKLRLWRQKQLKKAHHIF